MDPVASTLKRLLQKVGSGTEVQEILGLTESGLKPIGICAALLISPSKNSYIISFSDRQIRGDECHELFTRWEAEGAQGKPFLFSMDEAPSPIKDVAISKRSVGWIFPVNLLRIKTGYVIFVLSAFQELPSPRGLSEVASCIAIAYTQEKLFNKIKAIKSDKKERQEQPKLDPAPASLAMGCVMEIIAKSLGVQSAFFFASSITGGTRLTLVDSWPKNTPVKFSHLDYQKFCGVNTDCTQRCDELSGIPQCIFTESNLPLSDMFTQEIRSENVLAGLVCASSTVCSTHPTTGSPQMWGVLICFTSTELTATKFKSLHGFAQTIIHSLSKNLLTSPGGLGGDMPMNTLQYNDALYRHNQLFSGGKAVRISWELNPSGSWDVCSISKNAGAAIGYEPQEILGKNFAEAVYDEDLEGFLGEANGALDRNIRSWEQKYRIVGAKGEVRHLYGYIRVAFRGPSAKAPILLDGLLLDITDEVESRSDLEKTLQNLEWFTYAASHDLKEPTNTIIGRLRMATREIDTLVKASKAKTLTDSQVIEALSGKDSHSISYLVYRSLLAAKRLGLLMDDLLSYSRISRHIPEMSLFRSSDAIASVLDGLAEAINKSNAQIQILSEMPQIYGDHYKFEVLIQNLIENSIKFIKPGSCPEIFISCQLKISETASTLTLAPAQQKHEWQFTVADNGIGFDAATEGKKVFQPFGRLHSFEQYEGTGLGLASCQKIVSLWGGALWAEATPGEGASFSFTVPSSFNQSR